MHKLSEEVHAQKEPALTPFFLLLKLSFFLAMVFLIIRHDVGRLVEDVMGRGGLARAVQSWELGGADLLRAGGAGQSAAMLCPAVFTGAAGGRQEALGHADGRGRVFSVTCPLHLHRKHSSQYSGQGHTLSRRDAAHTLPPHRPRTLPVSPVSIPN